MKKIESAALLLLLIVVSLPAFGQRVALGLNISDLPLQVYGGSFRLEPTNALYIEGFGSYRPSVERPAGVFCKRKREGSVFDLSLGFQKYWPSDNLTISVGPYFQTKNLRGSVLISDSFLGCNTPVPERINIHVTGLRLGMTLTFDGFYMQGYGGLGYSKRPSQAQIDEVLQRSQESIKQEEYYAHARFILGWQFDAQRRKEKLRD